MRLSSSKIGLALSGGGSRAIAFHLGCMRALQDRDLLNQVAVLSTVSGGSVVGAMYAYSDCSFEEFESRVVSMLRKGLALEIVRYTLFSRETPKIVFTVLTAGLYALFLFGVGLLSKLFKLAHAPRLITAGMDALVAVPMRRLASRTTAFAAFLNDAVFGGTDVTEVKRPDLEVVINAAELRTGTAFRFGSSGSGTWRFGRIIGSAPKVGKAVAASAAYPALLPAIDEVLTFEKSGEKKSHRVIITDGGVYDNLGISCLLPGRSPGVSTHVFELGYIICCDAGQGLPSGKFVPYSWASRMMAIISTIHRRTHTQSYGLLHRLAESGEIKSFILPYLGQRDDRLPVQPPDLVRRSETFDYPTDFSPMAAEDIERISKRGEQLTRILIEHYLPEL